MQFISPAKRFANKALKVALSLLLVVGFLPMAERKAEAAEGNVKIVEVFPGSRCRTYGLADNGDLYLWGYGIASMDAVLTTPVKILENVATVCDPPTSSTNYAITEDGSLYAWGSNAYGNIGDGTSNYRATPVKVLDNVEAVDATEATAFALTEDGVLYGWGYNDEGWVGLGFTSSSVKQPSAIMENVKSFSCYGGANFARSFAITEDGSLYAWGLNDYGQLGNGGTAVLSSPTKVLDGVASVCQTDDYNGYTATYAIMEDGSLYAWGYNGYGQVGLGHASNAYTPAKVLDNVASIYPACDTTYAITKSGELYGWGAYPNGTNAPQKSPVKIMDDVASVETSSAIGNWSASFALDKKGGLYGWGYNATGQVGDGSTTDRGIPVEILDEAQFVFPHSGGSSGSYVVTKDGALYGWGFEGALAPEKMMDGVAGGCLRHGACFAIKSDGSLWAWGDNDYGQLGTGAKGDSIDPIRVLFPGDVVEDEPPNSDAPISSETIETDVLIRAEETGAGSVAYPVVWDDDWFLGQDGGNYKYNRDLAVTACALAASAYDNSTKNNHRHVKTTLRQLGFDPDSIDVSSYVGRVKNEDYGGDFDKVAYAFATKRIPDGKGGWDTLVAVAVRGTPGNVEWVSNGNVNDSAYEGREDEFSDTAHEGFYHASAELEGRLDAYLTEQGVAKSEAKFLVTGHSRGAAVANIVAARLNDDEAVDMRNVYAYCYATPRVSSSKVAGHHSAEYDNIINVVNPEDFVPRVPLAKWGYERYGRTYYLPCRSTQKSLWKDGVKQVKRDYEEYFGQGYVSFRGTHATDELVKDVYALAKDVDQAYTKKNSYFLDWSDSSDGQACGVTFIEYFRVLMNKLAYPGEDYYLWKLLEYSNAGDYTPVTEYFVVNYAIPDMAELDDKVFGAHSEKTYLLWTSYLADMLITPIEAGQKCDTGKMTMYCPVDVTVCDPDGNVVARIVDDVVDEGLAESDEGLAAYVDPETGAKSVWVPLGQGYRVETVATDSGTLDVTWSVSDPEGETLSQEARVDLPLEEGTTYTADVSDQGGEGAFEDSVSFTDGEGQEIQPDFESDAESAGSLSVSVTAAEGGTASGNAQATAGDHVTVNATAQPGYLFDGWYEGEELVSSEAAWTFRAEESRALEARFVECQHPDGVKPCEVCGYARFTIEDCDVKISPNPFTYAGTAKPDVAVSFNGVELVENKDYTLVFNGAGDAGRASAVIAPITGYISNRYGYWLEEDSVDMEFWYHFTISKAKLVKGMVSLPKASYVYNGKVQKPKPKVKVADTVQYASDYEFTYLSKSKKKKANPKLVGTYWIRVKSRPTAETTGTVEVKLVIKPKATNVSSLTRLNNGFRVKWKKRTVQCSGYQVSYRLKGASSWKSKTIKGCYNTSKKVTGLKDKRTYQVRVRTYKTVNGVKYYSAWSSVKTVKTK